MISTSALDRLAMRLEGSEWIDRFAQPLNQLLQRFARPGPLRDELSGSPLGHPAHPAIVSGAIGCWSAALIADATAQPDAARTLTGAGVLLAAPAVATGLSDWVDTTGAEQRVGFVHLALNTIAISCFTASWRARRRDNHRIGVAYGIVGATAMGAAAWFGGHLAYAMGVGVNTTAFDGGPTEWTEVIVSSDNPSAGHAAGVPLLIVNLADGPHVLADRCTHRGGPLSKGAIAGDCVACPWHGSRFSLIDGSVQSGPAVAPQPVYETRLESGRLFVRRDEPRSLRVNPVR
jgi:nitrite reductase/ring-hydroxylating ferredoxin subunit/uncharacterized membrane protein